VLEKYPSGSSMAATAPTSRTGSMPAPRRGGKWSATTGITRPVSCYAATGRHAGGPHAWAAGHHGQLRM